MNQDINIGSRWRVPSGSVYVIIGKQAFGKLEIQKEGTRRFGFATVKELRSGWVKL